jgi:hypothetical protein
LVAVEALRQGRQFVSAGLAGHVPAELGESQVGKPAQFDEAFASLEKTE